MVRSIVIPEPLASTRNLLCSAAITAVAICLLALPAHAGDVIDRIVATVNGHIILQSDWDDALAFEALTGGKPLPQLTAEDRKATLDRLVDQELLRQQLRPTDAQYAPTPETLEARTQDIRKQYPEAQTDPGWRDLLSRYGLTQDQLNAHLSLQLEILHMVDDHLTPTLQVDDKAIADYYQQTLLPQLRQSGGKEPALSDVAPKIRQLLTQQKLNDALKEWLQTLRESSVIRMQPEPPAPGGPPR
jgi:hypothetical protein